MINVQEKYDTPIYMDTKYHQIHTPKVQHGPGKPVLWLEDDAASYLEDHPS